MRTARLSKYVAASVAFVLLALGQANSYAWDPNVSDLDKAIKGGDFGGYHDNISAWINQKAPTSAGGISVESMKALLKDPAFLNALDQRQFIARFGVTNLNAFAKAAPANGEFMAWLMKNTQAMDLFLEAAGPTPIAARDENTYTISPEVLEAWRKISSSDPEAKEGICLKLAMAAAITAPGNPAEPLVRYTYFKSAHKNKELLPSFDNLTVWEYTKVVSFDYNPSTSDMNWAREMLNTWRPDLRIKDQVMGSVSEVWRRRIPPPDARRKEDGRMSTLLEAGAVCGGRARFGRVICQAFGVPVVGVGQPKHACFAAKSAYLDKPGHGWSVHQGAGWQVSKTEGTTGLLFVKAVEERWHAEEFSQIEHLRWLASTLTAKEVADAVRAVANKIRETAPEPALVPQPEPRPAVVEEPFKPVPGTIHVEAEAFTNSFGEAAYPDQQKGCIIVQDCFTGGKQIYFQKNMKISWAEYLIDVPATGTYGIVMRAAAVNFDQVLDVSLGTNKIATLSTPNTTGLWTTTESVEVKLDKGVQTLRLTAPFQRGVALRWFELKAK
jgi:hypothetical protein